MANKNQKTKKSKEKIPAFNSRITVGFLGLSILLILIILYFSLSQVKIFITPKKTDIKSTFQAEILTDATEVLAGTNIIPGQISTSTETFEKSFPVPSGSAVNGISGGRVEIVNNYSKDQPLIKTTRLLSPDGKLFRLEETITVPAGGKIEARVYADQSGPEFDIEPGKFTIPGLWEGLQDKIYATSYEKFSGGSQMQKIVTSELINQAAEKAIAESREKIRSQMTSNNQTLIAYAMGGSTWSSSVEPGTSSENFSIKVETPITLVSFKKENLESVALNNLIAKTPANQQFLNANYSTLKFELENFKENLQGATIKASLEGKSSARFDKNNLDINSLFGLGKEELQNHLKSLPEIEDVQAIFIPNFLKKVPTLKDRIYIEIVK